MINWSDTHQDNSDVVLTPIFVNVPSKSYLLSDIESRLKRDSGFCIATLNLDHVAKLRCSSTFRDAYTRHSHITADGAPIVWLSRLSGHNICLVPGAELIDPVAGIASRLETRVALFGSTQASLDSAARVLVARHPGLQVVAKIAPPMGFDPEGEEADACIDALNQSGAQMCFLALGAPKQEIFAIRAHERLPRTGFLSIGAGLDFISGAQTRAPGFVRAIGIEWLWRLAVNPRRLAARYGACIVILPRLTWTALRSRARFRHGA